MNTRLKAQRAVGDPSGFGAAMTEITRAIETRPLRFVKEG